MSSSIDFDRAADIPTITDQPSSPPFAEVQHDDLPNAEPQAPAKKTSVAVVVPDVFTKKFGDIAQCVRGRLEESLLRRLITDWKNLQERMVRSFAARNSSPSSVFDVEAFLSDALESIGKALEQYSVVHVTAADSGGVQASLGLQPKAAGDLSTPRKLMQLLQIIERVDRLTREAEQQRSIKEAQKNSLQSDRRGIQAQYDRTPAADYVNGPIRRGLELQMSRLDTQIADVEDALRRLDRRDRDDILAIGRILNVPYLPQQLPEVAEAFIEAVRSVPSVASRVSPNELRKLSGNPALTFSVELPKRVTELPTPVSSREVRLPPRANVRKPTPRSTPKPMVSALPSSSSGPRPQQILTVPVKGLGRVRVEVFTDPGAIDALLAGLKSGQIAIDIRPSQTPSEDARQKAAQLARRCIEDDTGEYVARYEQLSGKSLRDGCVCIIEDHGDGFIATFDDVPVAVFDQTGRPVSSGALDTLIASLIAHHRHASPSSAKW